MSADAARAFHDRLHTVTNVLICAECWHDLRQHSAQCDGPLCPCDKTPDTAPFFRLASGSTVVGTRKSPADYRREAHARMRAEGEDPQQVVYGADR